MTTSATGSSPPGGRVPLPEGLTRLSDGSLRVDGADGVAVISAAAGASPGSVSVDVGMRVLQALGGTYLPTVGPTPPDVAAGRPVSRHAASGGLSDDAGRTDGAGGRAGRGAGRGAGAHSAAGAAGAVRADAAVDAAADDVVPAEPGDETTLLKPVGLVADLPSDVRDASQNATSDAVDPAPERNDAPQPGRTGPELLETGIWEDPDEPVGRDWDGDEGGDGDTGGFEELPQYPEPEPGSGRRRRGAHRAPSASSADSGRPGRPLTADTPTAPDNSKGKQPQPVRAPQPLESLPNTEVVPASEAALVAAPPVRASVCPQGHANPPEIRECLSCSQPLTGVFSYVSRPALATLTLSTGAAVEVAGDVVVGRAPQVQLGGDPHIVALVTVPSPHHMVSRSHLMLTTSGWSILAQDLSSSNGTVLARPGATPVLLGSGMPTPVYMGDLMDVGDGVTLRIDPPAWLRSQPSR